MMKVVAILCGGGCGALARYVLTGMAQRASAYFPWGTLSVNVLGAFAVGILWALCERFSLLPAIRLFLFVGFLGAFTTFSTYSLETVHLLRDGETKIALFNLVANNFGSIAAVFIGFWLVQSLSEWALP